MIIKNKYCYTHGNIKFQVVSFQIPKLTQLIMLKSLSIIH